MKYYLITAQTSIRGGFIITTITVQIKEVFFGKKEISQLILDGIKKNNPEIMPIGQPNINFIMELTQEQYQYYNEN